MSIVAAQSEDSETSRLIIVVKGDDKIVRQVEKQLCKLYDVEQEQNGLFTYERKQKFSEDTYKRIRAANTSAAAIEDV